MSRQFTDLEKEYLENGKTIDAEALDLFESINSCLKDLERKERLIKKSLKNSDKNTS
jgi:hypothetical protein